MSALVAGLRTRPDGVRLCVGTGGACVTVRVEVPEVWDAVRVEAPPVATVQVVKTHALAALYPDGGKPEEFVMKFNGFEVLDEHATLRDLGAVEGSTFLLTSRRRRPVRG
jgi:hypothetical protein